MSYDEIKFLCYIPKSINSEGSENVFPPTVSFQSFYFNLLFLRLLCCLLTSIWFCPTKERRSCVSAALIQSLVSPRWPHYFLFINLIKAVWIIYSSGNMSLLTCSPASSCQRIMLNMSNSSALWSHTATRQQAVNPTNANQTLLRSTRASSLFGRSK